MRFFPLKVLFKHLSGSALVSLRGLGLGRGAFGHVGLGYGLLKLGFHKKNRFRGFDDPRPQLGYHTVNYRVFAIMRPGYAVLGLGYADVGLGYVVLKLGFEDLAGGLAGLAGLPGSLWLGFGVLKLGFGVSNWACWGLGWGSPKSVPESSWGRF